MEAEGQRDSKIMLTTARLVGTLSGWEMLPEVLRSKISGQVSDFVEQAKKGDLTSRQILTGVKDRLLKGKINIGSLPSLDWEVKDQPPKS